ncbi:hypothetical protein [Rubellimicrobium aerolatum]|uniref:Outer membrane beta-barrel protein n=1 Tax=Rubellimicrobium aerolatum TaxID=490979 RepID=A0ABW0S9H9_9RHOB|nr:hypothetical protein [Rubellimicrobium aerolatum]MBP1804936.1 hypothetical protein [Rubellimicrobium aerolatum]
MPVLAALALGLPLSAPAPAQEGPNPGLTVSLSQGLGFDTNADLDPGVEDSRTSALTALGLSYASSTPASRLTLQAGANVEVPFSDDEARVDGPSLSFGYERAVPASSFTASGRFSRTDVSFLRGLGDFLGEDGTIDLPDDFEDLEGEGTRQLGRLDASLSLRDDAPFGATLSAGVQGVDYSDVSAESELLDYTDTNFGAELRFSLTETIDLRAGFTTSTYEEDGSDPETERGVDFQGSIARPDGQYVARLGFDDTDEGLRTSLSFGRDLERPLGAVSGRIGVTRDGTGDLQLTGGVSASRTLPRGTASLALDQSVETLEGDEEELVTTLAARLNQEMTPTTSLSLDALYGASQDTSTDARTRSLELGATVQRQLTRAWNLSLGYRHEREDETGEELAKNDNLFLTLGRQFGGGL